MDKQARRQALKSWKAGQQQEFAASLPMQADLFHHLFDSLNEQLGADECDHSLRLTEEFLADTDVDAEAVIEWLAEQGGYCDCEVLANVEEKFLH